MRSLISFKSKTISIWKRYDVTIWVRFFGTFLTKVAQFMMYPFLILYLTQKFNASLPLITAIIGLESIAGFLMNLLFGGLSDRFGRKSIMMLSLAVQSFCLIGFIFSNSLLIFAFFITLLGAGSYMFFPAANAQIADIVPENRRAEVYSLLRTGSMIGMAIGPMIGLMVFNANPVYSFAFFAFVSICYLYLIWRKLPETLPKTYESIENKITTSVNKLSFGEHKRLFIFTFLAIPTSLISSQTWSTLPLHLKNIMPLDYGWIYSTLLTTGSIISALLQFWIGKRTEQYKSHNVIFVGYTLATFAVLIFAFVDSFFLLLFAQVLLVVGSIFYGTHLDKSISIWSPVDMRGRYFSIFGLHWRVSEGAGPFLGGILLSQFGGTVMFLFFSILLFLGGLGQYRLLKNLDTKLYVLK
ncbi:MDR family MFS transporter [Brevibacillus daliensis]|uniref:MDR family MFS transporter n=1 Tax=Brevibacillus daliensis TaxID=2892995 RepID=UPI001E4A2841|nr:MFS transporter [Brevibacillus daliensis]